MTATTASTDTTAADAARTATAAPGLRERKRAQTQRSIWSEAIALFLEHGFEAVTVNRIAAAANVSKMTVFNYFPTKEDLVITPMREHIGDAAHAGACARPGRVPPSRSAATSSPAWRTGTRPVASATSPGWWAASACCAKPRR